MLILIAGLVFGILLYRRSLRLEGASGSEAARSVRAYVDGKPVASYVKDEK